MSKDILEIDQHNTRAHRECSSTEWKRDHGYFDKEERDLFYFLLSITTEHKIFYDIFI